MDKGRSPSVIFINMPGMLPTGMTLPRILVVFLCLLYISFGNGHPPISRESTTRLSRTVAYSCAIQISFFGIVPYWKEVSRKKRWVRNILEGKRLSCHQEPCSVRVTYTEKPEDITKADVVVFANTAPGWIASDVWDLLIKLRPPGQKWVMSTQESPPYVPGLRPPERLRHISYDWSNTYRADGTFPSPYGEYSAFGPDGLDYVRQHRFGALIKGKKKSVAWVASHCDALQWNRTRFVQDLKGYIPVDTYGRCGDNPLPWKRRELLRRDMAPYKFYLSFENSCCDQYITEKFWRSLDFGMIPVVVGAPLQDYLDVAPPDSFIHVDQFESLEAMAAYIVEVSESESMMRKHLAWRLKGEVRTEEIQDHILEPISNSTLCSIVKRIKSSSPEFIADAGRDTESFDFYGRSWEQSCHSCGEKPWMEPYQTRGP